MNVPWTSLSTAEGYLRPVEELWSLYRAAGVETTERIIAYCIISVGSACIYVVLHELLGHPDVRNYDGSWLE